MANQTDDRIQKSDLIQQTWLGVVNQLRSLYSKNSGIVSRDIDVVPAADPDDFEYLQQQKGDVLELPVVVVSPSQVEADVDSYNRNEMRMRGYRLTMCDDRVNWRIARLAPTALTFRVDLISDDVLTMLNMVSRWCANDLWTFDLKFADWKATIQVHAEKILQIPPRVVTSGGSRQFRLTTTLRAKTYAGYIWKIPAIRKVEVEALLIDAPTIDAAMADPSLMSQTFTVTTIEKRPEDAAVQYLPEA